MQFRHAEQEKIAPILFGRGQVRATEDKCATDRRWREISIRGAVFTSAELITLGIWNRGSHTS